MDVQVGGDTSGAVPPFPQDQAREYFRQLCLGLEYLHHNEVVHRDVCRPFCPFRTPLSGACETAADSTSRSSPTMCFSRLTGRSSSCATLAFPRFSWQAMIGSNTLAVVQLSSAQRAFRASLPHGISHHSSTEADQGQATRATSTAKQSIYGHLVSPSGTHVPLQRKWLTETFRRDAILHAHWQTAL